jgi:hypothetical protein
VKSRRQSQRATAPLEYTNRGFQFNKRRQLFIRTHNETLSVATMCIGNPNRSPARIDS